MWVLCVALAALHDPPALSRRVLGSVAALACAASQRAAAHAATPIAANAAPIFGTPESRSGLLQGILSARDSETDLAAQYALHPADISGVALPATFATAVNAVLIFHGSGGPDRETRDVEARFRAQDAAAGLSREVLVFDWMSWFTPNTDRLSFASQSVGASLGRSLAANRRLRTLHVVGTSAGSFAADACCAAYTDAAGGTAGAGRAFVQLTLADPFAAKEGASFPKGRGAQFFGRSADFAEHILNTDDIVPNTEVPLPLCFCLDVTSSAERRAFPPPEKTGDLLYDLILKSLGYHSWPMGYVARHYETRVDGKGQLVLPSHADRPRGAVVKAT